MEANDSIYCTPSSPARQAARRTKGLNIYAPVPGAHHAFRVAVTALCVMALIEADLADPAAAGALARGEAYLLAELPQGAPHGSPDARSARHSLRSPRHRGVTR